MGDRLLTSRFHAWASARLSQTISLSGEAYHVDAAGHVTSRASIMAALYRCNGFSAPAGFNARYRPIVVGDDYGLLDCRHHRLCMRHER